MTKKVEFIESYIKHGNGDYEWNDNHGELIRCKDCNNGVIYCENGDITCDHVDSNGNDTHPADWFCADGVKKGGEHDA